MVDPGAATRRTLLKGALTGAGSLTALSLSACSPAIPMLRVGPRERRADIHVLNRALAAEQRAIVTYTALAPLLPGEASRVATRFLNQDIVHAGLVHALVKELGGVVHEPLPRYDLGSSTSPSHVLSLLHELERDQVATYLHAIPRVSSRPARQTLASILASDAQHVTLLRLEQGEPGLTGPLVTASE